MSIARVTDWKIPVVVEAIDLDELLNLAPKRARKVIIGGRPYDTEPPGAKYWEVDDGRAKIVFTSEDLYRSQTSYAKLTKENGNDCCYEVLYITPNKAPDILPTPSISEIVAFAITENQVIWCRACRNDQAKLMEQGFRHAKTVSWKL